MSGIILQFAREFAGSFIRFVHVQQKSSKGVMNIRIGRVFAGEKSENLFAGLEILQRGKAYGAPDTFHYVSAWRAFLRQTCRWDQKSRHPERLDDFRRSRAVDYELTKCGA